MKPIDADLLIAEMEKRHAEGDEITVGYVKRMTPLDVIPIPKDATNGDVIKAMFPNAYIEKTTNDGVVFIDNGSGVMHFDTDWWNAPYRNEQYLKEEEDGERAEYERLKAKYEVPVKEDTEPEPYSDVSLGRTFIL